MKKLALLALSAVMFTACGEKKKKNESQESSSPATEQTQQQEQTTVEETAPNEVVIDLNATDQMTFDKKEIRVKKGQKVKLNLHHTGKMQKNVMGHNFVLLKPGTNLTEFGAAAAAAADNNYIPKNTKDVIANTDVIGGGETTTIVFDAPEEGTYDFICSFPGHYAMMNGKFIVE